jgi:hypothetical protein
MQRTRESTHLNGTHNVAWDLVSEVEYELQRKQKVVDRHARLAHAQLADGIRVESQNERDLCVQVSVRDKRNRAKHLMRADQILHTVAAVVLVCVEKKLEMRIDVGHEHAEHFFKLRKAQVARVRDHIWTEPFASGTFVIFVVVVAVSSQRTSEDLRALFQRLDRVANVLGEQLAVLRVETVGAQCSPHGAVAAVMAVNSTEPFQHSVSAFCVVSNVYVNFFELDFAMSPPPHAFRNPL